MEEYDNVNKLVDLVLRSWVLLVLRRYHRVFKCRRRSKQSSSSVSKISGTPGPLLPNRTKTARTKLKIIPNNFASTNFDDLNSEELA